MNKRLETKIAALVTASILVTQLAGCSFLYRGKVLEAAEDFGEAIKSMDAADILDLTTAKKNDDVAVALNDLLDRDGYSDMENDYIDAITDTIEVEVDDKSVSISGDSASVDLVITMADYEAVLDQDITDIDELVEATSDSDTIDIEFTAEFVKDGDEWLVDNIEDDEFGEIFDFLTVDISFGVVPGNYVATADISFIVAEALGSDAGLAGALDMEFYLNIYDDNTYELSYDPVQLKDSMSDWFDTNAEAVLMNILQVDDISEVEAMAEAAGYSDYNAFLEDLKDVFKNSLEESLASSDSETQTSGTYVVDGDTIIFQGGREDHEGLVIGSDIQLDLPYEGETLTLLFVKQ